jgi:hypothetical protein
MEVKGVEVFALFVIDLLKAELEAQGHNNTGKLKDSITWKLEGDKINIYAEDYAKWVDSGRKAGAKRIPIDALMIWVEQRGIASGDKEVKNIAFAIQQKIFQEGSPTMGSYKFSANGRRDKFIEFTFTNEGKAILGKLAEVFDNFFKAEFSEMLTEAKQKYFNNK